MGSVWGILEIFGNISDTVKDWQSDWRVIVFLSIAATVVIMGIQLRRYFFHEKKIAETDASICVKVGDFTKMKNGSCLVGINNKLETRTEYIGAGSLHEQIVKKHGEQKVKAEFDNARDKLQKNGVDTYDWGEAFSCKIDKNDYVFLVMSELPQAGRPSVKKEDLKQAVQKFFHSQTKLQVANDTLYCPVLGTGAAGIPVMGREVIGEIVRSFVLLVKGNQMESMRIKKLVIVVWGKKVLNMDWEAMLEEVDAIVDLCGKCKQ